MRMLKMKYILFAAFLLSAAGISAQKAERDYIRKGNRLFNDSVFVDAEVNYRKALEVDCIYVQFRKYAFTTAKVSRCHGAICFCQQNRKG